MLIHLKKYILSGAIKFVSVRSSPRGACLSLFLKLQGLQSYFPENFRCNLTNYESEIFLIPLSITFLNLLS